MYTHEYMYNFIHAYIYIYVYTYICRYVYLYIYVCLFVCLYVRGDEYTYAYTCIHESDRHSNPTILNLRVSGSTLTQASKRLGFRV